MHLTCTNMPEEKVDIALRVSCSKCCLSHLRDSEQWCRKQSNTGAVTSLLFVETPPQAKMNGKPSKVVSSTELISSNTSRRNTATTLT